MNRGRFPTFAWGVLAYNVLVVLWGAIVRATGSGAGCGSHWPLCDGQVLPQPKNVQLLIEFAHRTMSGLALLLVMGLVLGAFRAFPRGHRVRSGALLSLLFILIEALIGAALVKFGWVADNSSVARAVTMAAHLVNTFMLLGALTLTACWSAGRPPMRLRGQGAVGWALALALAGLLALGASGAVIALGDTLFPARSLMEGLRQDIAPDAHFLIRLRLVHPLIAMSVGLYVLLIASLVSHLRPAPEVRKLARGVTILFFTQIAAGFLNVNLLAPVWMQIVHLLLADLLWINLVLLTAAALAEGVPQVEMLPEGVQDRPEPLKARTPEHLNAERRAAWKDYLILTKPRVISLLLFTTLTAMIAAARGWPGLGLFLAVTVGGYMAAGAANAINMVLERDLDGRMARTSKRPTVTQQIPSQSALLFGMGLAVGAFALLWGAANLLTAMLALAGLVFYVVVYTLMLKRRTWHNIVIGGAAGAFPPLVGWAAVTGDLSPLAWCLFALIFVWTPVHFWALALLIKDDYARAGVPMLPVVLGERATVLQIALYAVLTAVISVLPLAQGEVGGVYLGVAILLNAALLLRSLQLYSNPDRPRAVTLYKYSMVYLALLFLTMAVDRAVWTAKPAPDRLREPESLSRTVFQNRSTSSIFAPITALLLIDDDHGAWTGQHQSDLRI